MYLGIRDPEVDIINVPFLSYMLDDSTCHNYDEIMNVSLKSCMRLLVQSSNSKLKRSKFAPRAASHLAENLRSWSEAIPILPSAVAYALRVLTPMTHTPGCCEVAQNLLELVRRWALLAHIEW